jgi:hypothetical protein
MAVTEQESSKKPLFKPVKINLHSVLLGRDDDVLNSNDFELSFDRIIGTSGVGAITAKTNTESKESLKNAAVQVLPAPQTNITVVKKSVRDRLVDNLDDENSGTAATKQLDLLSLMDS